MALQNESHQNYSQDIENTVNQECSCIKTQESDTNQHSCCKMNESGVSSKQTKSQVGFDPGSEDLCESSSTSTLKEAHDSGDSNLEISNSTEFDEQSQVTTDSISEASSSSEPVVAEKGESPPKISAFKKRGRMFQLQTKPVQESSQFIMDCPDAFAMGADGSMMEMFNKLDLKN